MASEEQFMDVAGKGEIKIKSFGESDGGRLAKKENL
jgi:hypothetical protein